MSTNISSIVLLCRSCYNEFGAGSEGPNFLYQSFPPENRLAIATRITAPRVAAARL